MSIQCSTWPASPSPEATPVLEPQTDERTSLCPQYRVIIHNDDTTTQEFVIYTLTRIFRLEVNAAIAVMMEAHTSGAALVGMWPLEQAEFLVERAHALARTHKYPLTFTYEPE